MEGPRNCIAAPHRGRVTVAAGGVEQPQAVYWKLHHGLSSPQGRLYEAARIASAQNDCDCHVLVDISAQVVRGCVTKQKENPRSPAGILF